MMGDNKQQKIVVLSGMQSVLKNSSTLMENMDLTNESLLKASELFQQGLEKYNRGDYGNAIEEFNQALQINLDWAEAYFYRAMSRYKLQDFLGAAQDFNEVLRVNPQNVEAYSHRGLIRVELGDRWGAMQDYNQALQIDARHIKTYLNRSLIRLELEDYQGVITDCNVVLIINPKLPKAYLNRGIARFKLENYQEALDDYNRALSLNPHLVEGYFQRGMNRIALEEFKDAIADFKQALKLNSNYLQAYLNRGYARLQMGDNWGSLEDFDQALRLDPVAAKVFFNEMVPELSNELGTVDNHNNNNNPQLVQGLMIQGKLRYEAGDYQAALNAYDQVLKIDPNHTEAYNRRSTVRSALGDYNGAISDLEQAKNLSFSNKKPLQSTPTSTVESTQFTAQEHYQRGVNKLDDGDFHGAIQEFDRVLQMNRNDATTFTCRGFAYRRLGDKVRAVEDLQAAAKLFSEQGDLKSCLEIKEALQKIHK